MALLGLPSLMDRVALRKESVDRNSVPDTGPLADAVALRKESVDRNPWRGRCVCAVARRSPQGERG